MIDREKVIEGLECCTQHGSMCGRDCNGYWSWTDGSYTSMELLGEYRTKCPYGNCETGCVKTLAKDALALLKAQEPKIGHWVDKCCRDFHCSECNHRLIDNRWIHADGYCCDDLPKYCPECGVKMERGIIQRRFVGEDKIIYPDYNKNTRGR